MKSFRIMIAVFTATVTLLSSHEGFSQAHSYKNFEWEILRMGYIQLPNSTIGTHGLILGGEVRYNITDLYSIGLGADFGFTYDKIDDDDGFSEFLMNSSFSIDRYFTNHSANRPFIGASFGLYNSGIIEIVDGNEVGRQNEEKSIGFAPRVGIEINHLRLMAQYQFTTDKKVPNAMTITAGITLWGGYQGN